MNVWAIADLHLSFGTPNKEMDVFGPDWVGYTDKIATHWKENIKKDDLVLIAGDISWAMKLQEAKADLDWIDHLPGTKVLIKGNHDYWWSSLAKVKSALPPSLHVIQNNALQFGDISIAGARLWDSDEYSFDSFIDFKKGPREISPKEAIDNKSVFERELERLELSLKELNPNATLRLAMTHYPPIGADLKPSKASTLLEKYGVQICVFGHLHSLKKGIQLFGSARGVNYILSACDYLNFYPIKIS